MRFRDWKEWCGGLPWSLRWFVLLVLVRPALDLLYFLKEISPLLSPLYLVGVLTPVLAVASYFSSTFPRIRSSSVDLVFGAWGGMILLNAFGIMTGEFSMGAVERALKLVMPVVLYVFVRHLVRSRRDLLGLVTTFLYSSVLPLGMLLYERFVAPLGDVVHTRGYDRYEGLYADAMSYAIAVMGALLVSFYLFLNDEEEFGRRAMRLAVVGACGILGLLSMHHTASWGVAAALVALLVLHSAGKNQIPTFVFIVLVLVLGGVLVGDSIEERLSVMLESDVAVIEGEKDTRYAFHGRMWRWTQYLELWDEMPPMVKVFGVPSGTDWIGRRMLGGMLAGIHNDYLRVLFATGILGLGFYLLFFALLFFKTLSLARPEKFVVRGAMVVVLLYSVTTVPTMYPPLLYLVYAIFAYAALPAAEGHRLPMPAVAGSPHLPPPQTPVGVTPGISR